MLFSAKSLKNIETLQNCGLRFLFNEYKSSYKIMPEITGGTTKNFSSLRSLCLEIYKTLNKLNWNFMNGILELKVSERLVLKRYKLNLVVNRRNQVTSSSRSF